MLDTLIIALVMFAPFSMGVSVGLTILTYSISSGTDLPVFVLAITGGAPLIPLIVLLGRRGGFPFRFSDGAIYCLFAMRLFSVLFQPWFAVEMMPDVLKEVVFGPLFYFCGRLFVYRKKQAGFVQDLLLSLLIVFAIYQFSGRFVDYAVDLDRAVLGEASAVGLSLVFNILITLTVTVIVLLVSKPVDGYPYLSKLSPLWRRGMVICALTAMIGAYATYILVENGTRGAIAAAVAASLLTILLPNISKENVGRTLAACFVVAMAIMIGLLIVKWSVDSGTLDPNNRFDSFIQAIAVMAGLLDAPVIDPALIERGVAIDGAIDLFLRYPVFGCGINCTEYLVGNFPHNIILQILAENGLVGGVLLMIFLITSLRGAVAALVRRADPELVVISAIFVGILIHNMVSFTLNSARILMFFAGACVSAISYLHNLDAVARGARIRSLGVGYIENAVIKLRDK
jgi:O-antigen ligase